MQLTVAMSVLNGEPHLGSAVESILNQTHTDFTFIVVNNGSTDHIRFKRSTDEDDDGVDVPDEAFRVIVEYL